METNEYETCSRCGAMTDGTIYATKIHSNWHDKIDEFAKVSTDAIDKINKILNRLPL